MFCIFHRKAGQMVYTKAPCCCRVCRSALVGDIILARAIEPEIVIRPAGRIRVSDIETCFDICNKALCYDRCRMVRCKIWLQLTGVIQVIPFCVKVRIADPVIEVLKVFLSRQKIRCLLHILSLRC